MSAANEGHSPHEMGLAPPGAPGLVHDLGAAAIDLFLGARELYSVFVRTLYYVVRGKREKGAVVRQMFEIGNRSLFFVSITMGFIGMILALPGGPPGQARRSPTSRCSGRPTSSSWCATSPRRSAALMLATRVGAGIAAEIGSMVVTEQVDALRMCAADPIDFLLVPRFLASMVMTTVLIVWAGAVAFAAGAATAYVAFDVPLRTFCDMQLVDWGDLSTGLAKCVAYGAAIPIVSGYCGLSTFGGSEGVGWATTRAVVNSSLAIIVLNAIISTASLLVFGMR